MLIPEDPHKGLLDDEAATDLSGLQSSDLTHHDPAKLNRWGQKLVRAAGTRAGFAVGGIKGAVLGREAMSALEKLTTSTAWGTISVMMKDRLADARAQGDTSAIVDLTSRLGASAAAQSSEEDEGQQPAQRYRWATSQRL